MNTISNISFENLPSVREILASVKTKISIHDEYIKYLINDELDVIRLQIVKNDCSNISKNLVDHISRKVIMKSTKSLKNIINGTGIVLHTGFGRAPFQASTLRKIANCLEGYSNFEFNLETGARGDRQSHISSFINAICGSESSMVVNNNAAAVLLSINQIAKNGEVIVSRGQLVEIGGSFRIPDIINASGSILNEVGTTNRTKKEDYLNAINKNTKLLLWVHTSNYVIKGFTESVPLRDIIKIGNENNIPVMVDWGSGSFIDLKKLKLADEVPVKSIMRNEPDILTFSGDKLIGGPQSGFILGKKKLIEALRKNTLYRTMRCDKITISLIEETLRAYGKDSFNSKNLSLKMLTTKDITLKKRGNEILSKIKKEKISKLGICLVPSYVEAGSGSLPEKKIRSYAISFNPKFIKVNYLAKKFRLGKIPVVGYIKADRFYIDLKSVLPNQIKILSSAIKDI